VGANEKNVANAKTSRTQNMKMPRSCGKSAETFGKPRKVGKKLVTVVTGAEPA
jgi:hypothetical protein